MASDFPVIDPSCIGAYNQGDKLNFIYAALAQIVAGAGGGGSVPWFTPEQFGAKGNGVSDDTEFVQDAADAASAVGGMVLFASKTYKVTDTITIDASGVRLVGLGWGTKILASGDYGDIFLFSKGVVPTVLSEGIVGGGVYSMYIDSDIARTSGAAVHAVYTHAFQIHDVRFGTESPAATATDVKLFQAMNLENQSACDVVGCQVAAISRGAIVTGDPIIIGTLAIPFFGYDGRISACDFWGDPSGVEDSIGLYLGSGVGGFRLESNSNISHFNFGCVVDGIREGFLCQSYCDSNWDTGLLIISAELFHLDEAWAVANGNASGFIAPWSISGHGVEKRGAGDYQMTGGRYFQNDASDIFINSTNQDVNHVLTGVSVRTIEFGQGDIDNPGLSYAVAGGAITNSGSIVDIYPGGEKKVTGMLRTPNVP